MFRKEDLIPQYKNLVAWRPFRDTAKINLPVGLTTSETGEYYQDKSAALQLDYIQALIPEDFDITDFLNEKVEATITGMFNDILQYRQVDQYGKTLLEQAQLLNRRSQLSDKIINENRFVGLQIRVRDVTSLQAVINEVGIQLDTAQDLDLYLFHSDIIEPLQIIPVTTLAGSVTWKKVDVVLSSMKPELFHGGVFILGYYQEDLTGAAINYTNFNWDRGECGGCSSSASYYGQWRSIRNHFHVYPLYVPAGNYTKGEMFDFEDVVHYQNNCSFGLNLKFTVRCDLTDFFIQNKFAFKNLMLLKMATLILNTMKYSQQINYVEENLKMMIIRDLEGDKETNALNLTQQYEREMKAIQFNISGINNRCLDLQTDSFQPVIGQI